MCALCLCTGTLHFIRTHIWNSAFVGNNTQLCSLIISQVWFVVYFFPFWSREIAGVYADWQKSSKHFKTFYSWSTNKRIINWVAGKPFFLTFIEMCIWREKWEFEFYPSSLKQFFQPLCMSLTGQLDKWWGRGAHRNSTGFRSFTFMWATLTWSVVSHIWSSEHCQVYQSQE